ncbi:hypothetical protein F444_10094 [Phytophthora nicotianae P1976]|uniref:Uncharacterized protein n=1 Tax=Phytophthora nicotianae P1976 TaxID=1317066 RepID=A0A081A5A3_PHYNI|nr:hypothetical protein F444_10094 [Phytophthora nicotianae P1976]
MVDPYISTFNRLRQAIGGTGAACVLALPVVGVAALTAPVLMAGAVTTSAIGTGSVAAPVVATCAIGAKAVVVGGALERMPNTETTENKKTSATVKVVFMGIGATVGATVGYFWCVSAAALIAASV